MIENDIAGLARKLVQEQREADEKHVRESAYRSLCEGLPALLRTAGLARTLAFLAAKSGEGNEYSAILAHLDKQFGDLGICSREKNALANWIISKERKTEEYQHASRLAFRVIHWHKRLAQALLRKKVAA